MIRLTLLLVCFLSCQESSVVPLPNAHAHNDYEHDRPLYDALDHGFTSIEADVLLIDGRLYVGHDMPSEGEMLPTLEEAYLAPLDYLFANNGTYPGPGIDFYLMLDFKTSAEETYAQLVKELKEHEIWIDTGVDMTDNGVIVFISGNRPLETVMNDPNRLVALDGRPSDLGKGYSPEVMPIVSQNFRFYSQWDGIGEMSEKDQQIIRKLAEAVHAESKKLRLWGHPDNEATWTTLLDLGVDLINSDDLAGLQGFLLKRGGW